MASKKTVLLFGGGGRESAIASKFIDSIGSQVVVASCADKINPTISSITSPENTLLCDPKNKDNWPTIKKFIEEKDISLVVVPSDGILVTGITDYLRATFPTLPVFGPSLAGFQIESSKAYCYKILNEVVPDLAIDTIVVSSLKTLEKDFQKVTNHFGEDFVVKPDVLTGGKGVKVMGPHLKTTDEAYNYAVSLLSDGLNNPVSFQRKFLGGYEFTLQIITDGRRISKVPTTVDYPYRYEGDTGPGTGGMGVFTQADGLIPGLDEKNYLRALEGAEKIVNRISDKGDLYNGILYVSYFYNPKTYELGIFEINGRPGDPEAINIMNLLEPSGLEFYELIKSVAQGNIDEKLLRFRECASVVKYLVPSDYPSAPKDSKPVSFKFTQLADTKIKSFFASSFKDQEKENFYLASQGSRALALYAEGSTPEEASATVNKTVENLKKEGMLEGLDYRKDIGDRLLFWKES
jgi:phosphoribosylamine---glycine ligase